MDQKEIYLIVPHLMKQQTWGGDYIPTCKGIVDHPLVTGRKIGQSYELFGGSKLIPSAWLPKNKHRFFEFYKRSKSLALFLPHETRHISLVDLIADDPKGVLGANIAQKTNNTMPILIKFTQAQGNSFQLHVKEKHESETWKAKPETWYFLGDGLITLGLKPGADLKKFKKICQKTEDYMQEMSKRLKNKTQKMIETRRLVATYINRRDPWQFVNCLKVKKGWVVDLSSGGIHHSWEEDKEKLPQGNLVYEIQLDRSDEKSTLRCFDKGKIKYGGGIRDLQIADYFKYLDSSPKTNDPKQMIRQPEDMPPKSNQGQEIYLFENPHYKLHKIVLPAGQAYKGQTKGSFQHLFVESGSVEITSCTDTTKKLKLLSSWSAFCPACLGEYQIQALKQDTVILKTFI
ncbi:MAG TPA: hypothetical protein ENN77_00445 [Candidatus Wirthbacteria bacterium]|nr:hypothetical protein [Candidatus Wirthbacteria bacterium]